MTERLPGTMSELPDVGSYHDLRSLNRLRALGKTDEQAALRAAAKQFESVFLQELLKSMRAANEVFEDDDFFGGGGNSEFYEQMHDEQLALQLANQQALGLAEVMVQQLSRRTDISSDKSSPATRNVLPARPPSASAVNPTTSVSTATPVTPLNFVKTVLPHAEQAASALGVDPALLIAQAALETGWGRALTPAAGGKSLPVASDNNGHGYFGIKADNAWQGDTRTRSTLEYVDGIPQRQHARFRAYPSAAEAFADYTHFIQHSARYAEAVKHAAEPAQYAQSLQRGGYATDPAYAEKLMRVYNSTTLRDLMAEARKLL